MDPQLAVDFMTHYHYTFDGEILIDAIYFITELAKDPVLNQDNVIRLYYTLFSDLESNEQTLIVSPMFMDGFRGALLDAIVNRNAMFFIDMYKRFAYDPTLFAKVESAAGKTNPGIEPSDAVEKYHSKFTPTKTPTKEDLVVLRMAAEKKVATLPQPSQ